MGAIKLKFDPAGNVEVPTLVLSHRSGSKIGQLINPQDFVFSDEFENPAQFSFSIYKDYCKYWDDITNFKLLWVAEWDKWFEIVVETKEGINTTKYITATHLVEAELSQLMLYELEINTDTDIITSDYEPVVFFDKNNHNASLLHQVLAKAVNVEIDCADAHLARSRDSINFTFDDKSIYDALKEIAEAIQCHFEFDTSTDSNGNIKRKVIAYDMLDYCIECGKRDDFGGINAVCPVDSNHTIVPAYGSMTNVFFSIDNVADEVDYTTDTDSVKNCFRLEAGDDYMSDIISSLNHDSKYIYYWSKSLLNDMSPLLRKTLKSYNALYEDIYNNNTYAPSDKANVIRDYNRLITNVVNGTDYGYKQYNKNLYELKENASYHYDDLIQIKYDAKDFSDYLYTTLMPNSSQLGETSAQKQYDSIITQMKNRFVSVKTKDNLSEYNVDNAVKQILTTLVDSRYKVTLGESDSNFTKNESKTGGTWIGTITVTDYSASEEMISQERTDIAKNGGEYIYEYSPKSTVSFTVNCDYENFLKDQIDVRLAKGDKKNYSKTELLKKDINEFKKDLRKYSVQELTNIEKICNGVIQVLSDQGAGKLDETVDRENINNIGYVKFFEPYSDKETAIQDEITLRKQQINTINGIISDIDYQISSFKETLDLKTYLDKVDKNLWAELNSFCREDTYSNSNFTISDNDTNKDMYDKARKFMTYAMKDLKKSAEAQHTISVSAKNIFTIKEFEPLRNNFSIGNWIRVEVDGIIYPLRVLSYQFDFNNFTTTDITFSDVSEANGIVSDLDSVLSSAKNMATSFSHVERKADKGAEATSMIDGWTTDGLDATLINIVNKSDNQQQVWDEQGLLFRRKTDYGDDIDDQQIRIMNSSIVMTDNKWRSITTAIGRVLYRDPLTNELKEAYGVNAETLIGKLILGEEIRITNSSGSMSFDKDGFSIVDPNNLIGDKANDWKGKSLDEKLKGGYYSFYVNPESGNVSIKGNVNATSGSIGGFSISDKAIWYGTSDFSDTANIIYIGTDGVSFGNGFKYDVANNTLSVTGSITATDGSSIAGWTIDKNMIYQADSGMSSDQNRHAFWAGETNGSNGKADTDAKFHVGHDGRMVSTSGTIGCWTITADRMYDASRAEGWTGVNKYGAGQAFWAGGNDLTGNSAPYHVDHSGKMVATGARITGDINADSLNVVNKITMYRTNWSGSNSDVVSVYSDQLGQNWIKFAGNRDFINIGDYIECTPGDGVSTWDVTIPSNTILYANGNLSGTFKGTIKNTKGDYKTPVSSSTESQYYVDTIRSTSGGLTVYGHFGGSSWTQKSFSASSSDARLKYNISNSIVSNALEQIKQIEHKSFYWKDNDRFIDNGYIAQELEIINPNMVMKPDSEDDYYGVDTFYMTSLITKAIQEMSTIIQQQEERIKQLETLVS